MLTDVLALIVEIDGFVKNESISYQLSQFSLVTRKYTNTPKNNLKLIMKMFIFMKIYYHIYTKNTFISIKIYMLGWKHFTGEYIHIYGNILSHINYTLKIHSYLLKYIGPFFFLTLKSIFIYNWKHYKRYL
jgi:hypothetical protein